MKRREGRQPLGFAFVALFMFMIAYFARPEDWSPELTAVPFAKVAGVLISLALAFSITEIRWHLSQGILLLILLVVQLWMAAFLSPVWRGGAATVVLDFSKVLPLVIVICAAVRSIQRLRWMFFAQAASAAAVALVSIFSRHTVVGRLEGVLQGMYRDPNDLAVLIDLTLPLCLALALTARSYTGKLLWTATMLVMIYAVFLTASRTGAIALAVVAGLCAWKLSVGKRRLYLLLLIPTVLTTFWLVGGTLLRTRLAYGTDDASSQARIQLLIQSLKVTAQHPLFGVGPGNFEMVSGMWHVSHNSFAQISSEGGIAALVLYVLIFRFGFVNLRKISKSSKTDARTQLFSITLLASLVGFLVGSLFLNLAYNFFPYCLVAYASALYTIESRSRRYSARLPQPEPAAEQTQVETIEWQ